VHVSRDVVADCGDHSVDQGGRITLWSALIGFDMDRKIRLRESLVRGGRPGVGHAVVAAFLKTTGHKLGTGFLKRIVRVAFGGSSGVGGDVDNGNIG